MKMHQIFSVHTTPEEYKNVTITDHFGLVFQKLRQGNYIIIVRSFKMFSVQTKTKSRLFQIPTLFL